MDQITNNMENNKLKISIGIIVAILILIVAGLITIYILNKKTENSKKPTNQNIDLTKGVDSDGDGVPDEIEIIMGTDPHKADTDGDGINDSAELNQPSAQTPTTTPKNNDSDGDGLPDEIEIIMGTDPHKADTDGDGINDLAELNQKR